jgi:hypothetical protein
MIDLVELFLHWDAGRSKHELASSLGMDRKTVRKYLGPAEAAGLVPGQGLSEAQWRERVDGWFPGVRDGRLRQVTWPQFDARIGWVREQVAAGVNGATIHQRLVDEFGVVGSLRSFHRWLQATLADEVADAKGKARVTALMPPSPPGQVGQVDYGLLGAWTDPGSGKRHRVQAFIMTLPCSKVSFVYPTVRMDQEAWTAAHVAAFEFFGGAPARVVSDNLKTGVIKADLYDPRLNRAYRELATHYGTLIDPARAVKPKDKPHVERAVQYVRGSFWVGREFTSIEHMREEAARWSRDVAGQRQSRPLDGRRPWAVFEEIERPALVPLPPRRLDVAVWTTAKVGTDCHAAVKGVLYSIPHRFVGDRVDVRVGAARVEFYRDGDLIKTHPRRVKGRQTDITDYPKAHAEFLTRDPDWCRREAGNIGPAVSEVVNGLLRLPVIANLRSSQRIIALTTTHGPDLVNAACQAALTAGDPTLKTVRGLLASGTLSPPPRPGGDNGAGAMLRGAAAFTTSTADMEAR